MELKELEVLPETATDSVALFGAMPGTGIPESTTSLMPLLAASCPAALGDCDKERL